MGGAVAGTVTDIRKPTHGSSAINWHPPNPGNILYYNIKITHLESGEQVATVDASSNTTIDVNDYVESNGQFNVEVQAVTIVGSGNFSSPITVTIGDMESNKADSYLVIGIVVLIAVLVAGIMTVLFIICVIWAQKTRQDAAMKTEDKHIYNIVPDTLAPPLPLPRLLRQNVAYSTSLPEHMKINTAYDTGPTSDKPNVVHSTSSSEHLEMAINTAYDASTTPSKTQVVQCTSSSGPDHLNMAINTAYDAVAEPDKPHCSSSPGLKMAINTAYDAVATPAKSHCSSSPGLKMAINTAYDAVATPAKSHVVHCSSSPGPEHLKMTINAVYDVATTPDKKLSV